MSSSTADVVGARLVADDAYLPALMRILDDARGRVDVIAFSFSIGAVRNRAASLPLKIAERLVRAQSDGVHVRVYLEDARDTAERNRDTAKLLAAGGVHVTYGATHAKGVCVDGRTVLFGSTNFTNQSLTKNIEANLLSDDERIVGGFEQNFEHLWNGGRHGGVTLAPPMYADGDFEPALIDVIDRARARITFSIYFFDLDTVIDALVRAHRRGVHVRGLLHTHRSFGLEYVRRTEGAVRALRAAGITDLHFGPPNQFTHAKLLVRDNDELMLGTGNWLLEDVEIHPQLHARFVNPALARELAAHVSRTIEARATPA